MERWFLLYAVYMSGCLNTGLSLRCYHCHAHSDCFSGACDYGVACVTAVVGGHVSKGCLQANSAPTVTTGCKSTRWFGSEATICYCDHEDFCNTASRAFEFRQLVSFGLMLPILQRLVSG